MSVEFFFFVDNGTIEVLNEKNIMYCPLCSYKQTQVIDSRVTKGGKSVRRRRQCSKCKERFTTYEEIEIVRFTVVKRSGEKEDYDRRKIEVGLRKALEKRPVNEEKIQKILNEIEYDLQASEKRKIDSKKIGKMIMDKLRDTDEVAFIRFASVYKGFGSVESFEKMLKQLK